MTHSKMNPFIWVLIILMTLDALRELAGASSILGWQLIGVQSSAPAAKDRWRADNRAISVTGFRDKLDQLSQK